MLPRFLLLSFLIFLSVPAIPQQIARETTVATAATTHPQAPLYPQMFCTSGEIEATITYLMTTELGQILAAYYMVTSTSMTDVWARRKNTTEHHDVLIVDKQNLEQDAHTVLAKLIKAGVEVLVRTEPREPLSKYQKMHLKCMIILHPDGTPKLVITGSYNMTNQAPYNWEDIVILDTPNIIEKYITQHTALKAYCQLASVEEESDPNLAFPSTPVNNPIPTVSASPIATNTTLTQQSETPHRLLGPQVIESSTRKPCAHASQTPPTREPLAVLDRPTEAQLNILRKNRIDATNMTRQQAYREIEAIAHRDKWKPKKP